MVVKMNSIKEWWVFLYWVEVPETTISLPSYTWAMEASFEIVWNYSDFQDLCPWSLEKVVLERF